MNLDVTILISVELIGARDEYTEKNLYLEHLGRSINLCVHNSISKSKTLRLKGLGNVAPNGEKGDLYIQFEKLTYNGKEEKSSFCYKCGAEVSDNANFCSSCGTMIGVTDFNTQRQQEWAGRIVKCPMCGETLNSFEANCSACGYELRGAKSSSTVQEFVLKFENASSDINKVSLIRTFPIPNTKEDILEFMILAVTNIENSFQPDISEAWSVKFEQVYEKSKVLFGDLPEFKRSYDLFVKKRKQNNRMIKRKDYLAKKKEQSIERKRESVDRRKRTDKSRERTSRFFEKNKEWILIVGGFVFLLLFAHSWSIPHIIKELELSTLVKQVEEYIAEGDYERARIKANQIIDDSGWSSDSEEKWDDIRESLLDTIEEKEAEFNGRITVNFKHEELIGLSYTDVEQKLRKQGFTNISFETIEDLVTGWITKDGQVEEVTINGRTDFDVNTYFYYDVEIIISYHTFKNQ